MSDTVVIESGAAAGGAGTATANQTVEVGPGKILKIGILYVDSPPGTTDVVISEPAQSNNHPAETILTRTDKNTDGWFYPRRVYDDTAGEAISGEETEFVTSGKLNVSIAQANVGDSVKVTVVLEN